MASISVKVVQNDRKRGLVLTEYTAYFVVLCRTKDRGKIRQFVEIINIDPKNNRLMHNNETRNIVMIVMLFSKYNIPRVRLGISGPRKECIH